MTERATIAASFDVGHQTGYDDGVKDERNRVVRFLGLTRDDLERCLAAHDIEAGEHLK